MPTCLNWWAPSSEAPRSYSRWDGWTLTKLLQSDDFFVREAAAWPLAELAGPSVLRELFVAYQRGFDEGQDNDGFTAALLEIPACHSDAARTAIESIARSSDEPMRGHAEWLLEICIGGPGAAADDA